MFISFRHGNLLKLRYVLVCSFHDLANLGAKHVLLRSSVDEFMSLKNRVGKNVPKNVLTTFDLPTKRNSYEYAFFKHPLMTLQRSGFRNHFGVVAFLVATSPTLGSNIAKKFLYRVLLSFVLACVWWLVALGWWCPSSPKALNMFISFRHGNLFKVRYVLVYPVHDLANLRAKHALLRSSVDEGHAS